MPPSVQCRQSRVRVRTRAVTWSGTPQPFEEHVERSGEAHAEVHALRAAGYNARNYPGSWHEWSRHDELPLERERAADDLRVERAGEPAISESTRYCGNVISSRLRSAARSTQTRLRVGSLSLDAIRRVADAGCVWQGSICRHLKWRASWCCARKKSAAKPIQALAQYAAIAATRNAMVTRCRKRQLPGLMRPNEY